MFQFICFFMCLLCRMQYPEAQLQELIANLANITSNGSSTLPQLIAANAFISDVIALSFAGEYDASAVLNLTAAVAASPAAGSGFGLFLFVQPVVDALQQLVFFAEVRLMLSVRSKAIL